MDQEEMHIIKSSPQDMQFVIHRTVGTQWNKCFFFQFTHLLSINYRLDEHNAEEK